MRRSKILRRVPILLLLTLSACFRAPDPRWDLQQYGGHATPELQKKTCALAGIRTAEIEQLRILGDAVLVDSDGSQSARMTLVSSGPQLLRAELFPSTTAMALLLAVVKDKSATILKPTEQTYRKVPDAEEAIFKLLKVRLLPNDLPAFLTGRIPARILPRLCTQSGTDFYGSVDNSIVTIVNSSMGHLYRMSLNSGLVLQTSVRRASDEYPLINAIVQEDDFPDPELEFPKSARVVFGDRAMSLELRPSLVKIHQTISPALFDVAVPPSYKETK